MFGKNPNFGNKQGGWIGAAIGAAAGLLGGAAQNKSAKQQSAKQMAFQERMSNTAYQRSAKDLEKAGLNRILALGNPASTPGGSQAPIGNLANSAMSAAQAATNVQNVSAQTKLTKAQTQKSLDDNYIKHEAIEALRRLNKGAKVEPSSAKDKLVTPGTESYNVLERIQGLFGSQNSAKSKPKIGPLPPVYGEPEKRAEYEARNNSKAAIRSRRREAYYKWLDKHPKATYKESQLQKIAIAKRIH